MKLTNAAWVFGVAAALILSTGTARADETGTPPSAPDAAATAKKPVQKAKTTTTPTTTSTQAKKKKAKATDETSSDKTDTTSKGDKTAQPEKSEGTVGAVTKDTDEAAKKANESIVGPKTQMTNEERARDPNLRPKDDRDAKKAGEAVGRATTTAAEGVATVVADTTRATDEPGPYEPFAISVNPLGLIVGGRYSIQGEWVPVTHHAIIVSPHFIHTSADIAVSANATSSQTFTGAGGEAGYRYYTGHRGPNGVFIGPSLIVGAYNASLLNSEQAFTDIGGAVDVGFKGLVADHLALGGGVGIEYLHVSHDFGDLPTAPAAIASSGVKPRLLFEAGYAF